MFKLHVGIVAVGLLAVSPAVAGAGSGSSAAATDNGPVSRKEFEEMKRENAEIKQDNAEMKQELADIKAQQTDIKKTQTDASTASDQQADEYDKDMQAVQNQINAQHSGAEGFVLAGDAEIGFTTQRKTPSSFDADVSPLILWQPPETKLLVEAAFDLGIGGQDINSENSALTVNLADISYEACDYFIIGGGLFAVPFGQYHNHFDPPWINKFPDDPLAFDAIAPVSEVGIFAKGVIPSGTTKWTYDIYLANGPNLDTVNSGTAGQLNFNDYTDLNNNKAVGGRLGFLPFPDVEAGYSIQYSSPSPSGFQKVRSLLQAVDFHYKPTISALGGQFDLASEWIWADTSRATYDPTGSMGFGPLNFGNWSQGGYVSLGYRPTLSGNIALSKFEPVVRYDSLHTPIGAPWGDHESRVTFGLDYWFTPYCVGKIAYEADVKKVGQDQDAFMLQLGYGL